MAKRTATTQKKTSSRYPVDSDIIRMIGVIREGISGAAFVSIMEKTPFTLHEWAALLKISPSTLKHYILGKKTFSPSHSERILEISQLYEMGLDVFNSKEKFMQWLELNSRGLGDKPKNLLDTTFGIALLKKELGRIEHGIFA